MTPLAAGDEVALSVEVIETVHRVDFSGIPDEALGDTLEKIQFPFRFYFEGRVTVDLMAMRNHSLQTFRDYIDARCELTRRRKLLA